MNNTIISANIRFDNPRDGAFNWPSRRELLAKILLKHVPLMIGTQEGRRPQLNDLENLLPQYQMIQSHRSWIEERMYPSLYYQSSQLKVIESGDFWLSETPDVPGSSSFGSAFPRLCTYARLKHSIGDLEFYCFNLHLDHQKSETRQAQIKVCMEEIKKIAKPNIPLLLMGDFNEGPLGAVREIINRELPQIYDPWPLFHHLEIPSHHEFGPIPKHAERIDWILIDQKLKAKNLMLDQCHEEGLYPSDHFPVVLSLNISSPK